MNGSVGYIHFSQSINTVIVIMNFKLTDCGPHGVHGDIVVKHVVEEPENVIERAQTRPQVTEGRTVLDLLQLLKVAILSIVQVSINYLFVSGMTKTNYTDKTCFLQWIFTKIAFGIFFINWKYI